FIGLAGIAASWPLVTRAQQGERMRRGGAPFHLAESDPEGQARPAKIGQALGELGWIEGRNLRLDVHWGAGNEAYYLQSARELISLGPDVVIGTTTPVVTALQRATVTVPIVFVNVIDPVGSGVVASLARPGGNTTGFVIFEFALAAKWLGLLKEIAPRTTRAAVLRDPALAAGVGQFAAIQTVAPIGLELSVIDLRDIGEIEHAVDLFPRDPNGGLIVTASQFGANHPDLIAATAARYRLPAVYPLRYFVSAGGLISYGPDTRDDYGRAAGYVDRILKGARPADLPVQAPARYELAINLKTAKALGTELPATLLARADEVIE